MEDPSIQDDCIHDKKNLVHSLSTVASNSEETEKFCAEGGLRPLSETSIKISDDPVNPAGSAMDTLDPDLHSDTRTSGDEPPVAETGMDVGQTSTGANENSSDLDFKENLGRKSDEGSANEVRVQPEEPVDEQTQSDSAAELKYTLSNRLKLLTGSWKEYGHGNYFRGCKWAPDGSCILTCSNDSKMRLFNLPTELYSNMEAELPELTAALTVPQGESVYDFCWYPRMSSWEPETCCFLTCCKDHPIHLWDAFSHQNRASYVPYNHLDEVIAPYSVAFSLDGERIFAGFLKNVKIFSLSRPGRECTSITTHTKKNGGQSGIISCIAMCPAVPRLYALGSYSCSVGVYSEDVKGAVMVLSGISSGVTHTMFSQDGQILYTGFRKDNTIVGWDLRNPGQVLQKMTREVDTNQRIYFDSISNGRYLVSGSTSGQVYGWEISPEGGGEGGGGVEEMMTETAETLEGSTLEPVLQFRAHTDAVNGISVHPSLPVLATCSGQRHFPLPGAISGDCSEGDSEEEEGKMAGSDSEQNLKVSMNCLKLWSFV